VVSGLLNLSRNLGLVTGTAAMGNVFAWASGTGDFAAAAPGSVAHGMRWTFAVAAGLMVVALGVAMGVHGGWRLWMRWKRLFASGVLQHAERNGRQHGEPSGS
jgi:hypothetical protein